MQDEEALGVEFEERIDIVMNHEELTPEEKANAVGAVAADLERRLAREGAGEKTAYKVTPVNVSGRGPLGILSDRPKPAPEPVPARALAPEVAKAVKELRERGQPAAAHIADLLEHGAIQS